MGYNSTVIVMNDALHAIREDPEFGRKLAQAILTLNRHEGRGVDISAGMHCNAAIAIETHHADSNTIIAVGGNCATVLGATYGTHHEKEDQLEILKQLADKLGYSLRKKKERKQINHDR